MITRFASLLLVLSSLAACGGQDPSLDARDAAANIDDGGVTTAEEATALQSLREEEKLAHDVYVALNARAPVFANISASEQTHTDAVRALLDRYGVSDPAQGRAAGSFSNATFQTLYDALTARGSVSTVAALQVGAEIEELDIADIRAMRAAVTHADVSATLDNLERGSRNHLRSFWRQLQSAGGTYTPSHLDAATFRSIAESAMETGASR